MTLTVYGMGQSSGCAYNDAAYFFTFWYNCLPITPYRTFGTGLSMDGEPIDNWASAIPSYTSDHVYVIHLNAPGGQLTFGVLDTYTIDNTGAYYIIVAPGTSAAYSPEPDLRLPWSPTDPDTWTVIQGFNAGDHGSAAYLPVDLNQKYALDLERNDNQTDTRGQPVYAAASGTVAWTQLSTGCVSIRHTPPGSPYVDFNTGQRRWYFTMYCHMNPILVSRGQTVTTSTELGQASDQHTADTCSSRCPVHLHFQLYSNDNPEDRNNATRLPEPLLSLTSIAWDASGHGPMPSYSFVPDGSGNQYVGWQLGQP